MKLYRTKEQAIATARKLGLIGLTGSGQACGPEYTGEGWYYRTAHNAFGGDPYGSILLDGGEIEGDPATEFIEWVQGWGKRPAFLD